MCEDTGLEGLFVDGDRFAQEQAELRAMDFEEERKAWIEIIAEEQREAHAGNVEFLTSEWEKFPSFFAIHGRKPVAGVDYDPNAGMCQDDFEFYSGTGRYSDIGRADTAGDFEDDHDPGNADGDFDSAMNSIGWGDDDAYLGDAYDPYDY